MSTLLDTCIDFIDMDEFADIVIKGISDPSHDVKIMSLLMLQRLAKLRSNVICAKLEKTLEPLKALIEAKTKTNAVKQEIEKNAEQITAALKTLFILDNLSSDVLSETVALYKGPTSNVAGFV